MIFNSEKETESGNFYTASGYIPETTVFKKRECCCGCGCKGCIQFYNINDELLAEASVPSVDDGKVVYQEICC